MNVPPLRRRATTLSPWVHGSARCLALASLLACLPVASSAQTDSMTVVAGARHGLGPALELLLGGGYRQLWTLPVRVEVLDVERFAGGLRPLPPKDGAEAGLLHFQDVNGRRYTFQPLDRALPLAGEPALRGTLAGRVVEDRTSARHPAAPIVAAALLRAAGVWHHAPPRLLALPGSGVLGMLQEEFSGSPPFLREDPGGEDGEARPVGVTDAVVDTDELIRRLRESPEERVDSRAYLAARVMDLYLGAAADSGDRWLWTRSPEEPGSWTPIPLGREYAFAHHDGLLFRTKNRFLPAIARFDERLEGNPALAAGDLSLDHQILSGLPREEWSAVAAELQRRLADTVIAAALRQMPPEYHAQSAAGLGAKLRARRDQLPQTVDRLYQLMSSDVDVHGTERVDLAFVQRFGDGSLTVRLHAATPSGEPETTPYFQRRFQSGETREVRIHLHGGNDRALLVGEEPRGPRVRVIGGAGEDVLADSSEAGWGESKVAFHDDGSGDLFLARPRTFIDQRPPSATPADTRRVRAQHVWGAERSIRPTLNYHSSAGVVLGGKARYTRYGFRQLPFAYDLELRGAYASAAGGFSASLRGEFHRISSDVTLLADVLGTQYGFIRYHGFGNESEESDEDPTGYDVLQDQIVATTALRFPLFSSGSLSVGPVLKYTEPRFTPGSLIDRERPLGSEPYGQLGATLRAIVDRRDDPAAATRGLVVESTSSFYPAAWDVADAFGRADAKATVYMPMRLPRGSVLGVSVSGEWVWGNYPIQEAAFLGGGDNLRGFRGHRFAGDGALYGRAGVRTRLTTANLLVRGDLGTFVVADAGRVFYRGAPSDRWHGDVGAGLWFLTRIEGKEPYAVSITLARGEWMRLFVGAKMPF